MNAASFRQFFSFRFDWDDFVRPLADVADHSPGIFRQPTEAFLENLKAVVSSVSLPALLVSQMHETLKASREFRGIEQITERFVKDETIQAAIELLRQGTILTWAALEVLSTDLFVQLLNLVPDLSINLLDDERTNKRFQLRNIPLKMVHDYGYDLSKKMGALFVQRQALGSTDVMRDVFDVLCPESEALRSLLAADRLWLLNQRRNLIVHRRAVIDDLYRSSTGEQLAVGSSLEITPDDIGTDLRLVRDVGIEILRALPARLKIVE